MRKLKEINRSQIKNTPASTYSVCWDMLKKLKSFKIYGMSKMKYHINSKFIGKGGMYQKFIAILFTELHTNKKMQKFENLQGSITKNIIFRN